MTEARLVGVLKSQLDHEEYEREAHARQFREIKPFIVRFTHCELIQFSIGREALNRTITALAATYGEVASFRELYGGREVVKL